jgi:hypothetical protein
VLAGVAGALPASAAPAVSRYSADAFLNSTVACVQTFVGVFPVAASDSHGGIVGVSMNAQVDRVDVCAATPLIQASTGPVSLAPGEFTMDRGLNRAQLHAVAVLRDAVSGQDLRVSIALAYRAAPGSCSKQVTADEVTTFCDAVVSGMVTDGVQNFTPDVGQAVFQEHRPR